MAENKETFEEGVQIAPMVTDVKDVNKEALEHLNEMERGMKTK